MDQIRELKEECKNIVAKMIFLKNNNESFKSYKKIYEDKKYLIKAVNELFGEEIELVAISSCAKAFEIDGGNRY